MKPEMGPTLTTRTEFAAADDSWQTACLAFTLTLVLSFALWRWCAPKPKAEAGT